MTKKEKIEQVLNRGVEKIYPSKKALEKILLSNKKIRIYQGFDPSAPSLHLGNYVGILKLKQFQQLGHEVIFLVGDFTGMIGDPTDKASARKKLTRKQVLANYKNWKKQLARFVNLSGKNPVKIMFNSSWLDKISFKDLIEITSNFTAQQILQRDFFQERLKKEKPIYLHEFLYPIAQAIDSVSMDVDLEIGGNDQTFNMLAGRDLMKATKGKEKFVLTTKLLVDKEGEKLGKTTGNAIFLNNSPQDIFGKIMAFPDEMIMLGLELLTTLPLEKIAASENPMALKKKLGFEVVKMNYGEKKAEQARNEFERVFGKKELPEDIKEINIKENSLDILGLLVKTKLVSSKSQAKRLVLQGGVKINKKKQTDWQALINIKKGMIIQVGKRKFIKIK